MAVRRLNPEQPTTFAFTPENQDWAQATIKKYPEGKQASAVIPLLWRAQEQHDGWLPEPAIREVAKLLEMPTIRVYEVATFYTMFQLAPVGKKAHVQVCGTTPCMLRGSGDLIAACKKRISQTPHTVSQDGDFSWEEVECLGSCANAPMVQIWKDTYEDLTPELFEQVLDGFGRGDPPKPGSQQGRTASATQGGLMSLKNGPVHWNGGTSFAADQKSNGEPVEVKSSPDAQSNTKNKLADEKGTVDSKASDRTKSTASIEMPAKPDSMLAEPRDGKADDLKRISGVGPKLESILNELGIYHYDQIAGWSADDIAWVDENLKFKGRIDRDDWITQAKQLAAGQITEFAMRQDEKKNNEK